MCVWVCFWMRCKQQINRLANLSEIAQASLPPFPSQTPTPPLQHRQHYNTSSSLVTTTSSSSRTRSSSYRMEPPPSLSFSQHSHPHQQQHHHAAAAAPARTPHHYGQQHGPPPLSAAGCVRHPFESIAEDLVGAAVLLDAGAGEVCVVGEQGEEEGREGGREGKGEHIVSPLNSFTFILRA